MLRVNSFIRNMHFLEEDIRHILVEMLSSMNDDLPYLLMPGNLSADRCCLDELGPCADNGNDLYRTGQ